MDRAFITYCLLVLFCSVPNNDSSAIDESAKSRQSPPSPLERNSSRKGGIRHQPPAIHFPTDAPKTTKDEILNRGDLPGLSPPTPCPDDALFCESADDYPKDLIKDKLKDLPDVIRGVLYEEIIGNDEVHNKFGPGTEKELCSSKAQVVFPNKAKSKEGVFEFVVNDEEHKQGIRVETCMSNGGQCDLAGFVLSNDYRSKCVQKYITRQLVVLNQAASSDVNGIITKPFDFPSCCSCVISRHSSAESRFGGEHNTTPAIMTAPPAAKPVKGKPKTVE